MVFLHSFCTQPVNELFWCTLALQFRHSQVKTLHSFCTLVIRSYLLNVYYLIVLNCTLLLRSYTVRPCCTHFVLIYCAHLPLVLYSFTALNYCPSLLHSFLSTHLHSFLHSFATCFALFYCSHLQSARVALIWHSFTVHVLFRPIFCPQFLPNIWYTHMLHSFTVIIYCTLLACNSASFGIPRSSQFGKWCKRSCLSPNQSSLISYPPLRLLPSFLLLLELNDPFGSAMCYYVAGHGVWKSQKKSYSTLRAKRATFTFWLDKS